MAAQGALKHLLRARHFSASSQTGRSITSARWQNSWLVKVPHKIRLQAVDNSGSSLLIFSQSFPVLPDTMNLVTPESQGI